MSGIDEDRTVRLDDLAAIMDRMWREMVAHPFPQACKHYMAGIVIQAMERLDIAPPNEIIRAIVFADDATALAWERPLPSNEDPAAQS